MSTGSDPLLVVDSVVKQFGGLYAVRDTSFEVDAGSITGLIGPNGAGKSTMFNLISGVLPPSGGTISLAGEPVQGLPPDVIAAKGLARTFQTPRLFTAMTVWENLMVAGQQQPGEGVVEALLRRKGARERERALSDRAHDILAFLALSRLTDERAANLSGGQRKLLSLGQVLMMQPELVLLDEPAAGVNPTLATTLYERIRALNADGITFLLVEHNMDLIMNTCHHIIVMHNGRVLAQGTPEEIQANPDVLAAYLGGRTE